MRKWAKNTSRAALLAAGALTISSAFGPGVAGADMDTSGKFSILGGNQVNLPISVPVNVVGNAVSVLGVAKAKAKGSATAANVNGYRRSGGDGGMDTSGKFSILGGNQVNAPISVPINACGNAVAVLGLAKAKCKGGAHVLNEGPSHMHTSGKFSILGGNQVNAPVSAPVNVCGNSVAVAGLAKTKSKCAATVTNVGGDEPSLPSTKRMRNDRRARTDSPVQGVGTGLVSKLNGVVYGTRGTNVNAMPAGRKADPMPQTAVHSLVRDLGFKLPTTTEDNSLEQAAQGGLPSLVNDLPINTKGGLNPR
ncbi:chaplin [Actinomadura macrotermitis]|uniref:Chaplin domain-containing protein n=1 Tax=Actinomadura macrotermitis TaxID=2585200 RepID=A0A7K0BRM1_9ACTN|nr:chaplin [Actinomadura macrotermitis]MQY03676.1 hypothetical protein [Actinomadura macrotermitis]